MEIEFTGRHLEITPEIRRSTQKHAEKLSRLLPARARLHVILTAQRHLRAAEITLTFRRQTLVAAAETDDPQTSIKAALDKLERQVLRGLQRRQTKKLRPAPTRALVFNVLGSRRTDHQEYPVLERERWPIELMPVDEAVESLKTASRGIVVFRNSETDRVNVVYRRPDGNLALIEPEP